MNKRTASSEAPEDAVFLWYHFNAQDFCHNRRLLGIDFRALQFLARRGQYDLIQRTAGEIHPRQHCPEQRCACEIRLFQGRLFEYRFLQRRFREVAGRQGTAFPLRAEKVAVAQAVLGQGAVLEAGFPEIRPFRLTVL